MRTLLKGSTAAAAILTAIFFLTAGYARGSDALRPEAPVQKPDRELRERLLIGHLVRQDPLSVVAEVPAGDDTAAYDQYMVGIALRSLGQFTMAGRSFYRALGSSDAGSRLWQLSLREYIAVAPHLPEAPMPDITGVPLTALDERTLLHLAGFLAERGDEDLALKVLKGREIEDPELEVLAALAIAGYAASGEGGKTSLEAVFRPRPDKASPLTDMLYLARGYHSLQAGRPDAAREAFLAVPPASPYSPEALYGHSWSMIRKGDIQGAAVTLEELVDRHGDSRPARDGALDLALCYRELGLYDMAEELLERRVGRLREVRNWLENLRESDFSRDGDLMALLESLVDGGAMDPALRSRTPDFVKFWLQEVSGTPYVLQTTALIKGARKVRDQAALLERRLEGDERLVLKEIRWTEGELARNSAITSRLGEIRARLPLLKQDMGRSLQGSSLNHFGSESSFSLLNRAQTLTDRLAVVENSVKKAEGFSSLVSSLSEAVTSSPEEGHLNRVRQQAYEGILSSRRDLRDFRESLLSIKGEIWLSLKNQAIRLEKRTSLRATSAVTRAGQARADSEKARQLLTDRLDMLAGLSGDLAGGRETLSGVFTEKIDRFSNRVAAMRARELLRLASAAAGELREVEARTMYTAADIEISRMENTVRNLQEAVE